MTHHLRPLSKTGVPVLASVAPDAGVGFLAELLAFIRDLFFVEGSGGDVSGTPLYDLLTGLTGKFTNPS